jgi:ABC-type nitrate/sulfonate/bicarbonate transport system permease component
MTGPLTRSQFWRLTATGAVAFLAFWYLARALHFAPPQFLPMPHEVLAKLIDLTHTPFAGATLVEHMMASLKRFGMGFGGSMTSSRRSSTACVSLRQWPGCRSRRCGLALASAGRR